MCSFTDPTNSVFENNTVYNSSGTAISIQCNNVTIMGNEIHNASYGINNFRDNNTIIGNNIYDSRNAGIRISNLFNCIMSNNLIAYSAVSGIEMFGSSANLYVNTIYGSPLGLLVNGSDITVETGNNEIYDNGLGIYLDGGDRVFLNMSADQLYGNTLDFEIDVTALSSRLIMSEVLFGNTGLATYVNFSLDDNIFLSDYHYSINYAPTPTMPVNYLSFYDKSLDFQNLGNNTPLVIESLTYHWTDAEADPYVEYRLQMWKYNGTWILLNNTPDTANNQLGLTDMSSFSDFSILVDNRTPNISISKADETVQAENSEGGLVVSNITVTNTGEIALNATVADVLPTGLTYSASSPGYDSSPGAGIYIWDILDLAPGESVSIQLNATVDSGVVDGTTPIVNLTNYANVTGTDEYGENVTSEDYLNFTILYANATIAKQETSLPASPGGIVEYTILINNTGAALLPSPVNVTDLLPPGLTFDSVYSLDGSCACVATTSRLDCSIYEDLSAGNFFTLYVNATVDQGIVDAGTSMINVTNCANHTSVPSNGFSVNDSVCTDTTLYYVNISVTKDANSTWVYIAANATFFVNVTNEGQLPLNVTVADDLQPGLTFRGSDVTPTSVAGDSLTGQTVTWEIAIPANTTITITYNVTSNIDGTYANNVTVTGVPPNGDNVTANDSSSIQVMKWPTTPNDNKPQITVSFSSSCEGNIVTTNADQVQVFHATTLSDVASGPVVDGIFNFTGCGFDVRIRASGEGSPVVVIESLIDCSQCIDIPYECTDDDDCDPGQYCNIPPGQPGGRCEEPPPECTTDADCEPGQYCDIPAGQFGGSCRDMPPDCLTDDDCENTQYCDSSAPNGGSCEERTGDCGYADGHVWINYDCGDDPACPLCPEGYVCIDNECVPAELEGPPTVFVGDDVPVNATIGDQPCANCEVIIEFPDGSQTTRTTDGSGFILVPADLEGDYQIKLVRGGSVIASLLVSALPIEEPIDDKPPAAAFSDILPWLLWLLILLLLIIAIILWRRKKQKREK
ncbi:DUF11 domain-containing protein [Candidatus Micrarchaeota archaeon]|nr:DUF11 domain-containing protein [Candidatus Micrarchaeota archaeon]